MTDVDARLASDLSLAVVRRASQEWLRQRLEPEQRETLLVAADLTSGIVDESA